MWNKHGLPEKIGKIKMWRKWMFFEKLVGTFKKIWVRGQKKIIEIFLKKCCYEFGKDETRKYKPQFYLCIFFFIYNWHSLWKLPSSNLASSLQSRLIISLPLSNDENFTLNLARHLLTYILSSGLEQEQCSGIKYFLRSNFYFFFFIRSLYFTWCFILSNHGMVL